MLLAALALAGCKDKPKPSGEEAEAVAEPKQAAVDPNLAKAVAAASAEETGSGPSSAQGPPPKGIFEPGAADQQLAQGKAPIITLGSEGEPPRVRLSAMQPEPGSKHPFGVKLSIRAGRTLVPTIEYELVLEAPATKPPAPGDDQPQTPGPIDVSARIVGAAFDSEAARKLPDRERGLDKEFKGGKVAFRMDPNGAGSGFSAELKAGTDPGLQHAVDALGEVLAMATLPYPDKPVGKGAYWMATTRETYTGFDTVAYRLVKVERIQEDSVFLDMNVKRYAANATLPASRMPPNLKDLRLEGFQCTGNAKLTVRSGTPVPIGGRLSSDLLVLAVSSQAPGPPLPILQSRTNAELAGAKPAPAAGKP